MRYWRLEIAIRFVSRSNHYKDKLNYKQISPCLIDISIISICERIHGISVSCTQFCSRLFEIPRNFVAFNAENELTDKAKSLQKDGQGELQVRRPRPSDEIPNFQRPEK